MKSLENTTIIKIIIFLGILIRFIHILFIPLDTYQLDSYIPRLNSAEDYENLYTTTITRTIKDEDRISHEIDDSGHINYAMHIYKTWKLPNSNFNQFYHPPLNAFLSAVLLKTLDFTPFSAEFKIEALQILPFIYSSITLIYVKKILDQFEISNRSKIFALLFCAFNPISIIFAGSLTNDTLVNLFSIISIYRLIKWYQNSTFKNILLLAIPLGLGSITKHSILVNYIIAGIVFLIKLKKEKNVKILYQIFIFAFSLLPITFAYPIRNYILFKQVPFAVQPASPKLYIGNYSLWEQFKPFDITLLHSSFELQDHNLFSNVLRTSINPFWFLNNFIVIITYFIAITLLIVLFIGIIALLNKKNKHINFSILVTTLWLFSFIMLNLTMPYSCSSHARYIMTPILLFGIQLGFILDNLKNKKLQDTIKLLIVSYVILSIIIVIIYTFFPEAYYNY